MATKSGEPLMALTSGVKPYPDMRADARKSLKELQHSNCPLNYEPSQANPRRRIGRQEKDDDAALLDILQKSDLRPLAKHDSRETISRICQYLRAAAPSTGKTWEDTFVAVNQLWIKSSPNQLSNQWRPLVTNLTEKNFARLKLWCKEFCGEIEGIVDDILFFDEWFAARIAKKKMDFVLAGLKPLMEHVSRVMPQHLEELFTKPLGIDKIKDLKPGLSLTLLNRGLNWQAYLYYFRIQRANLVKAGKIGPPGKCIGYSASLAYRQRARAQKLLPLFNETFTPESALARRRSLDLSRDGRVTHRHKEFMDEPTADQAHHNRLRAHDEHHSKAAGHLHVPRPELHELLNQHQTRSQASDQ